MLGPDDPDAPEKHFSNFRRTTSEMQEGAWAKLLGIAALVLGGVAWLAWKQATAPPPGPSKDLVLYCAHDLPFVEPLIAEFEEQSGINVRLIADTEANKSLGLTRRLEAERNRPVADVFWNNQLLGTIDLARKGLFQPHTDIVERDRFPKRYVDEDGLWTAFGARLRIWMINRVKLSDPRPPTANPLYVNPDFCVADPMYGTTLTHAAVLWGTFGEQRFKQWWKSLPGAGVRVVPGNSATRDLVASGVCTMGWTDTDDYFGAVDRDEDGGLNFQMEPVKLGPKTLAIPNSVAIVKSCRHPDAAKKFVTWLLSEETERKLAEGPAAQVPLGRLDVSRALPTRVDELRAAVSDTIDLKPFVDDRQAVLDYLSGRRP